MAASIGEKILSHGGVKAMVSVDCLALAQGIVDHGIAVWFARVWLVGSFCSPESGAGTQLRPGYYLAFD